MARQDEEYWGLKIRDIFRTNLNTVIGDINTEKADGLDIATLNTQAFILADPGRKGPNFDPLMLFIVDPELGDTEGGEAAELFRLTCQIVVSAGNITDTDDLFKTLARYRRAIRDVVRDHIFTLASAPSDLSLISLPDFAFHVEKQGLFYTVGIGLQFSFV